MHRSFVMGVSILVASIAGCAPERREGEPSEEGGPVVVQGRLELKVASAFTTAWWETASKR